MSEELNARVAALEDFQGFVTSELNEVNTTLTQVLGELQGGHGSEAVEPVPWTLRATAEQWDELVTWVDWLWDAYEFSGRPLPDCWPLHVGAVEELSAMWTAWRTAAVAAAKGDGETLNFWHDRVLVQTSTRVSSMVQGCREGHKGQLVARKLTDRRWVPSPAAEEDQ